MVFRVFVKEYGFGAVKKHVEPFGSLSTSFMDPTFLYSHVFFFFCGLHSADFWHIDSGSGGAGPRVGAERVLRPRPVLPVRREVGQGQERLA